jgi:hypothetical protein
VAQLSDNNNSPPPQVAGAVACVLASSEEGACGVWTNYVELLSNPTFRADQLRVGMSSRPLLFVPSEEDVTCPPYDAHGVDWEEDQFR